MRLRGYFYAFSCYRNRYITRNRWSIQKTRRPGHARGIHPAKDVRLADSGSIGSRSRFECESDKRLYFAVFSAADVRRKRRTGRTAG